jgi:hypothetical protein
MSVLASTARRPAVGWHIALIVAAVAIGLAGIHAAVLGLAVVALVAWVIVFGRAPVVGFVALVGFLIAQYAIADIAGHAAGPGAQSLVARADDPMLVLMLLLSLGRLHRAKGARAPLLLAAGFAAVGIASAFVAGVPLGITALGAWLGMKLWILLCVALTLPWDDEAREFVIRALGIAAVVAAAAGAIDFVAPVQFRAALGTDFPIQYRLGFASAQGIFPHPGAFGSFMALSFAVFVARYIAKPSRGDLTLAVITALGALMSLRLKTMIDLPVVLVAVVLARPSGIGRKTLVWLCTGSLALVLALSAFGRIAQSQLDLYAGSGTTARTALYTTSRQIAHDHFPVGVGFGRFGSWPSTISYSPVFYEYGLSGIYGLSPNYRSFINDTSWPTVLGETGVAGLVFYALALFFLGRALWRRCRTARRDPAALATLSAFGIFVAILTESTGSPVIFNALPVAVFAIVAGSALSTQDHPTDDDVAAAS